MLNPDDELFRQSTPEDIESIYWRYKKSKLDNLAASRQWSNIDALIGSGADIDEVIAYDKPDSDLPTVDYYVRKDGQKAPFYQLRIGSDGIDHGTFEHNIHTNAVHISRRIEVGTYVFAPFREVIIPKDDPPDGEFKTRKYIESQIAIQRERRLAVASIRDVLEIGRAHV